MWHFRAHCVPNQVESRARHVVFGMNEANKCIETIPTYRWLNRKSIIRCILLASASIESRLTYLTRLLWFVQVGCGGRHRVAFALIQTFSQPQKAINDWLQ